MKIINMAEYANSGKRLIITPIDAIKIEMYYYDNVYSKESEKYPLRKHLFDRKLYTTFHGVRRNYLYCFTPELELCVLKLSQAMIDKILKEVRDHNGNIEVYFKSEMTNVGFPKYDATIMLPFIPTDSEKIIMNKLWTNRSSLDFIAGKMPFWYESPVFIEALEKEGISCTEIIKDQRNKKLDIVLNEEVVEKN